LRRKRKLILQWSIAAGLFVSALLACLLYWLSNRS
jgi:high-affinity Fe2+/Pb2+ permease